MEVLDKIALISISVMLVCALFMMIVMLPLSLMSNAKCLEMGYPESKVTFSLDAYCVGIQGSVNNKIINLD